MIIHTCYMLHDVLSPSCPMANFHVQLELFCIRRFSSSCTPLAPAPKTNNPNVVTGFTKQVFSEGLSALHSALHIAPYIAPKNILFTSSFSCVHQIIFPFSHSCSRPPPRTRCLPERPPSCRPQIDRRTMIQDVLVPWCMFNMFMSVHENIYGFMPSRLYQYHLIKKHQHRSHPVIWTCTTLKS